MGTANSGLVPTATALREQGGGRALPVLAGWMLLAGIRSHAAEAPASGVAAVSARIAGSRPEDFRVSPVPGIYEYRHGAEILHR